LVFFSFGWEKKYPNIYNKSFELNWDLHEEKNINIERREVEIHGDSVYVKAHHTDWDLWCNGQ